MIANRLFSLRSRIPVWIWPIVGALWVWPGNNIHFLFDNPTQPPAPGPEGTIIYVAGFIAILAIAVWLPKGHAAKWVPPVLVAIGYGVFYFYAVEIFAT